MSGRLTGAGYLRVAQSLIDTGFELPTADKKSVNVTRLSEIMGIPTQSIYKNPGIRALVDSTAVRQGLSPLGGSVRPNCDDHSELQVSAEKSTRAIQRLERQVQRLETQNAALMAENSALRQKLKDFYLRLGREDMTIDTGRRIADPMRSF